jgi:hypothetical protein
VNRSECAGGKVARPTTGSPRDHNSCAAAAPGR